MRRRWRWTFSGVAFAQDLFEEHALVRDVLVDDPEAFIVDGEDEGVAQLAERLERGERVEVSARGRVRPNAANRRGWRIVADGDRVSGKGEASRGCGTMGAAVPA